MVIFITGPKFRANLSLMHALKLRLTPTRPDVNVRIVDWGCQPAVIHPHYKWFILAYSDMPEDAPWPEEPHTIINVDAPVDEQVGVVMGELG